MKQLITSRLSFYFYIILCFAGSFINLSALNYAIAPGAFCDAEILNMYTTLRVIRMVHDDTPEQLSQEADHQDFIVDVMSVRKNCRSYGNLLFNTSFVDEAEFT